MIHGYIHSPEAGQLLASFPILRETLRHVRGLSADAASGITELRGRGFYANVHGYETQPASQCRWESHRQTIDFQVCLSGGELISIRPGQALLPDGPYNESKDTQFWSDNGETCVDLHLQSGEFVIFFPDSTHRPKVNDGRHAALRKVVYKIAAPLLIR
jgi:YhcH/YjgK/YiaL family protein